MVSECAEVKQNTRRMRDPCMSIHSDSWDMEEHHMLLICLPPLSLSITLPSRPPTLSGEKLLWHI